MSVNARAAPGPVGDLAVPDTWTFFAPFDRDTPLPAADALRRLPDALTLGGTTVRARTVRPVRNQVDFKEALGGACQAASVGQVVWIFVSLSAKKAMDATLGLGGDSALQAWLDGAPILDAPAARGASWPPAITDHTVTVRLEAGAHVLAVRLVSGKGSALLALGGPRELRAGDTRSILADPLLTDARWTRPGLRAAPGDKPAADIGSRRELFVDAFLVDALTGSAERRLHHPVPREAALRLDRPWEGPVAGYFTVFADGDRFRLYYSGRPAYREGVRQPDTAASQVTCTAESRDGIRFTRPDLDLFDTPGEAATNIVWRGAPSHNFAPFRDPNPDAPADQRYKAIAYAPAGRGLGVFGSADGLRWRALADGPVLTQGAFDSHNLAFWDSRRRLYAAFVRTTTGGLRRIAACTSPDFLHWTEPVELRYADARLEHLYTNNIQPYARAPHVLLGLPARYVPERTKVPGHPACGVSDAILMSSRDGLLFERWEEGFLRPGPEPEVWTDRNNYPAWGIVQTAPDELSLYWTEHYRHPGLRLRRGTLRVDGFVSLHAGGREPGELLTRPLLFAGSHLELNVATSAVGTLRVELCDPAGEPLPGFALADSEILYGNETAHRVRWQGGASVAALAGRPIRLRARLHDADLYAFQFTP